MFDDELKTKLQNFWQSQIDEIKENKLRFTAVFICFILAVIFYFTDENSGGEEIDLSENPAPVEKPAPVENLETGKKIIAVKNSKTSDADKNITVVLGANSESLYVGDPFQVPKKPEIKKFQPPPELPAIIPPVAQIPPAPTAKFILRGTAIIGNKKSALIQKIVSEEKNSAEENLILELGEFLEGKKIIDINQDSLTLDDGSKIFIDSN